MLLFTVRSFKQITPVSYKCVSFFTPTQCQLTALILQGGKKLNSLSQRTDFNNTYCRDLLDRPEHLFKSLLNFDFSSLGDIAVLEFSACWEEGLGSVRFAVLETSSVPMSFPFPQGESVKYFLDNLDRIGQLVRNLLLLSQRAPRDKESPSGLWFMGFAGVCWLVY